MRFAHSITVIKSISKHAKIVDFIGLGSFVSLTESGGEVAIIGEINGGIGDGLRAFHIHEKGDLGNDCKDAGGHFNPYEKSHGGPKKTERHVGDLGNIEATLDHASIFIVDKQIKLSGNPDLSVLGRAIVIHEGEDDLGRSGHPAGAAGGRIMCCTITDC